MFCNKCGTQNEDGAQFCANCGKEMKDSFNRFMPQQNQADNKLHSYDLMKDVYRDGRFGCLWFVFSASIPLLGFILYFVWRKEKPKNAKTCLISAIVSTAISAALILGSALYSLI